MHKAAGKFTVTLEPLARETHGDATIGRMTLAKTFDGDLVGRSEGQMLTAMTPVKGSAAYVAVEWFQGALNGRQGGFALVHRGVMTAGDQQLMITIVPDSGSGELLGVAGSLSIDIREGQHFYALDYELP
jgi:hypothetical protein